MPISREPSQRGLGWVRWNSTKENKANSSPSNNYNNDSKRIAEPDIVHLGGGRVGNTNEERSGSQTDKPLAQWAYNPLTSNPTGGNIAGPNQNDSQSGTLRPNPATDADRPLTQWFPTWQQDMMDDKNESRDQAAQKKTAPQANSGSNSAVNAVSTSISTLNSVTTSITVSSPGSKAETTDNKWRVASMMKTPPRMRNVQPLPEIITPLRSPEHAPAEFQDTFHFQEPLQYQETTYQLQDTHDQRPAQFPKRSTSLSQASRYAPPRLSNRPIRLAPPLKAKEIHLRRTQSNAEVQRSPGWRDQQAARLDSVPKEEKSRSREPSPRRPDLEQSPIFHAQTTQDSHPILTPLHSGLSHSPSTLARRDSEDNTQERPHSTGRAEVISIESVEISPIAAAEVDETRVRSKPKPKPIPRMSGKERYWLHKNYRGEAAFLKAWGLDIMIEEDRVEGMEILRDLMEGEAKEDSTPSRARSLSNSSTRATSPVHEPAGLHVIAEEGHGRDVQATAAAGSPDKSEDKQEKKVRKRPSHQNHSRTESNDSVLGEYLDLRLDV
ncbi:hypothetical protein GGS21DRAFT_497119 [Xylaria nigripes]|nr:hypothetical protein GGS21DRAFT_497119 [Xylaria nigripes]